MKMSGTKPMKNTMRKPSPMKQGFMGTVSAAANAVKKVRDVSSAVAAVKAKKEAATTKSTPTTKPGKPAGKPNASAKTPAMQLKKHKC